MSIYLRDPNSGKVMLAKNAQKPSLSGHGGRTWDSFDVDVDGETVKVHLDTTWGRYSYFEKDGHWYKVNLSTHEETLDVFDDRRSDYPNNYKILYKHGETEQVSKSEWDAFCEGSDE